MNGEEGTNVSASAIATKVMAWKAKKIFTLVVAGAVLLVLLFMFVILSIFPMSEEEEESKEEECTATHITIVGETNGNKVELRIMSEEGMNIPNVKGTIKDGNFRVTKKMSVKEMAIITTGSNEQKAWNYFRRKGYTEEATAGILGNLAGGESGLNPKRHQDGGGPGRGIAQWTVDERWVTLKNYAKKRGLDPWALETQLEFVDYEIFHGQMKNPDNFKKIKDVDEATEIFCNEYERPGIKRMSDRKNSANSIYKKYKGAGTIVGNITLTGKIVDNSVTITGTAGSDPIKATGSVAGNKFSANGYLGDMTGCVDANVCGFSWPLGDKQKKSNSPACVFRGWAGSYHCGDDYSIGGNPNVYSITSGTVIKVVNGCPRGYYGSSCGGGYGNQVLIDHGNIMNGKKVYSLSGHLLNGSIKVKKGDKVTAGQVIAKVGSSGSSTGDHLHFELNNYAGGATKSTQCSQSYCYKKQGGVYGVLETLKNQVNESCEEQCINTDGASKKSKLKTIKTIGSSDVKKLATVKGEGSAINPQGLADNGTNYVITFVNYGNTEGRLVEYSKTGKRLRAVNAKDIKHGNGATYSNDTGKIYVVHGYGNKRVVTFDGKNLNNRKVEYFPKAASGVGYDEITGNTYLSSGTHVYVLNKNLKYKKTINKKRKATVQDMGGYNGIALVIAGYPGTMTSYIDMYRVKDKAYIGSYKVNLGELESVLVDDGHLILLVNREGYPYGYLYKMKKKIDLTSGEECDTSSLGGNSKIISWAKEFIGKPYCHKRWNGEKPLSCTDCSLFTRGVYLHVTKKDIGGSPDKQCAGNKTYEVAGQNSTAGAKPGDIICFWGKSHGRIHYKHVGLFIDQNTMIHETSKTGIKIVSLKNRKWKKIVRVK